MNHQREVKFYIALVCGSAGKESTCNVGDLGSIPGLGDPPEKGKLPTPVFWPGEFHGMYGYDWGIFTLVLISWWGEVSESDRYGFKSRGVYVCMLSHVQLFVTLWTVTCRAPLSMRFSRQEYWSVLLSPTPGALPNPGIEPPSLASPAFVRQILYHYATWKPSSQGITT